MSDAFFDKFIADLVKGAEVNSRANGGPGVNIIMDRENHGHEEKFANRHNGRNFSGVNNALSYVAGLGVNPTAGALAAPISAGLGAAPGSGLRAAGGSLAGMGLGGLAGLTLGGALGINPTVPALLGGGIGSTIGAHLGGKDERGILEKIQNKLGALEQRYAEGATQAAAALGIKEAFLPMLGAIAGPMLARAGLGALGRGAAGKALGGIAGKVAPRVAGGLGGAAFDQAASMAGGALGQKMQQPQQSPGMMG